jgi:hypothetical protein
MAKGLTPHALDSLAARFRELVTTPDVLRLINDITTCTIEWESNPSLEDGDRAKGLELFPCLTMPSQRHPLEIKGTIYPNLPKPGTGVSHLIRLEVGPVALYLRLRATQIAFLLSPFHYRFLSMLFGRLAIYHASTSGDREGLMRFTPYSLEEQVVADYFQSLQMAPCATIKLDAQDNPYIGSMLYSEADLRRCKIPGNREEAIIRAWRLFKRLLYYAVEGERLYTGFAFLSPLRPLEYYRQRLPSLLWYHEANYTPLEMGLQALKQFLLNADGHSTFLAMYQGRIVGLLKFTQGTQRQLTSANDWRRTLGLATISQRGRISFWVALKGRRNPQIPLSLLEYRHGHLHIPLFQDVFWHSLEQELQEVCPEAAACQALPHFKKVLESLRRSGHGAIFLLGLAQEQLEDHHHPPIENAVRLALPVPLNELWLDHLAGLAKSDGALIFNDRLEACQFRARLKPAGICLLSDQDDLGSGMRHQVTREFTAFAPNVLGICISQDGYISLYRQGRLLSRLF